jgi:hypothetical protein
MSSVLEDEVEFFTIDNESERAEEEYEEEKNSNH